MPALGHLPREEAVIRLEAGQPREVGEAGVGRHHQDQHRAGLEGVVEDLPERAVPVDLLADLADHGRRAPFERDHLDLGGEDRQTEEHDPQTGAHDHERLPGVLPGRLLERRHPVRDRLDPGDRRAARGKGVQHAEQPGAVEERVGVELRLMDVALDELADEGQITRGVQPRAEPEQHEHVGDEEVGGNGEHLPGLLHPPQVPVGDQRDEEERDRHLVRREDVEGRHQRGRAGRGRHGDGEDVVGEERGAGHLGRHDAEVVTGDEVGASRRRVRLDRLPVAQDQEPEHHDHRHGDGHHQREGGQPHQRDEDVEDLLRRVRRGRQVVRCEHRQRGGLAEPLVVHLVGVHRRPEQLPLQAVGDAVGRQRHPDVGGDRLRRLEDLHGDVGREVDRACCARRGLVHCVPCKHTLRSAEEPQPGTSRRPRASRQRWAP